MNVTIDNISYKDIRDLSEANLTGHRLLLKNEVWVDVFRETDVNKKWENFYISFHYYLSTACPIVRKKIFNMSKR
jgi:hypothetical protein